MLVFSTIWYWGGCSLFSLWICQTYPVNPFILVTCTTLAGTCFRRLHFCLNQDSQDLRMIRMAFIDITPVEQLQRFSTAWRVHWCFHLQRPLIVPVQTLYPGGGLEHPSYTLGVVEVVEVQFTTRLQVNLENWIFFLSTFWQMFQSELCLQRHYCFGN